MSSTSKLNPPLKEDIQSSLQYLFEINRGYQLFKGDSISLVEFIQIFEKKSESDTQVANSNHTNELLSQLNDF